MSKTAEVYVLNKILKHSESSPCDDINESCRPVWTQAAVPQNEFRERWGSPSTSEAFWYTRSNRDRSV